MSVAAADPGLAARAADAANGGEPLGAVSLNSLAGSGWQAVRHATARRSATRLGRQFARIAVGRSGIEPDRHDWRFRDPTWRENPAYRRLMQCYLAWAREIDELADNPGLSWRDRERARFLAGVLTSGMAPTNWVAGNPEALKRALETGGISLLRGAGHMLHDIRTNGGMPSTVDTRGFVVGENLAASPGRSCIAARSAR